MTLSDKLQLINTYKGDIRTSIANKGVDISSTTPLSEYSSKIDSISGGVALVPNRYAEDSLTVEEGNIISGFTTDNYFQFASINLNGKSWELNIKVKTPETWTFQNTNNLDHLFSLRHDTSQTGSGGRYGLHLYFGKSTDTTCWIGGDIGNSSGNGWLIISEGTASISTAFKGGSFNTNTIYYFRMAFDGTNTYSLSSSTDGITYETLVTATTTEKTYSYLLGNKLGVYGATSGIENPFYNGKVYLEDTYIKVDGDVVWTGVKPKEGQAYSSNVKNISNNGEYNVEKYGFVNVDVEGGSSKKDFAKIGSPTITSDGIMTTGTIGQGVVVAIGNGYNFYIETKIKAHFGDNTPAVLLGNYTGARAYCIGFANNSPYFGLWLCNGSDFVITGDSSEGRGTTEIIEGTEYYIKTGCDNGTFFIDIKTDEDGEYTREISYSTNVNDYASIGIGGWIPDSSDFYFTNDCSIDLSKTTVTTYTNLEHIEI